MTPAASAVLLVFAGMLGGIVGSFLNACIYRMPRGISLLNPRRSFCPSCNKMILWYENLPVVSWLLLRGKCSGCGCRISARYPLVELLTAGLFVGAWMIYGYPAGAVYWVLLALLVAASFIDIEFFIIPDEITWGGTAVGVALATLFPSILGEATFWAGALASLAGAALGFCLLWLVVEGGKLAFGRKSHSFDPAVPFVWTRDGDRADLRVGEETLRWEDIFSREKDVLLLRGGQVEIDGKKSISAESLRFFYDRVIVGNSPEPLALDHVDQIKGLASSIVIPREAMGFGDVKFIAAIGAFLGWKAVLFTIFAASIIGCLAAVAGIFIARDRAGSRVPFGPFLALGAVIWIFGGDRLAEWYLSVLSRTPPSPL
ncbi:MAG: hypothetical protein Fur0032_16900 [Terrimicrobiaceae bacterium]